MELDWNFPHHIMQYEDGAYRWNYNMKENGNNAPFWTMIGICAAVSVPIALIMLVMMSFNALAALVIIGGAKKYVAPLYNRVQ